MPDEALVIIRAALSGPAFAVRAKCTGCMSSLKYLAERQDDTTLKSPACLFPRIVHQWIITAINRVRVVTDESRVAI